ncbi:hypothetical protein VTN02DRAFT_3052 [Thermoascus thermophilus]
MLPDGGYPVSDSVSTSTSNSLSPTFHYAPSSQTSLEWNYEQREAFDLGAAQNDLCPSGTDPSDLVGLGISSPGQSLADSRRSSASGLLGELSMSFTNPTVTGICIQDLSLSPHLVVPNATDDFASSGPDERSELLNRLDVIRSAISNGRFPDAQMRQMNRYLAGIFPIATRQSGSLRRATDSRQRRQSPSPGSPFPDSRVSRFYCVFCRSSKIYGTRGSWKRHITDKHRHCSFFRCCFQPCNWRNFRRDKVHEHIRRKHDKRFTLTPDQIDALEIPLPGPDHCDLCNRSTCSWDDYFRCLADHCLLSPEKESDNNNGIGARRHGDGDGSGRHEPNGGSPPDPGPPGFGGYGAPHGGSYSSGTTSGSYFTYSRPRYTYKKASVGKTASCSPDAHSSVNGIDGNTTQPQSSSSDQQAHQKNGFPGPLSSELNHPSALPPDGGGSVPHRYQRTSKLGRMVDSMPPSDAMRSDEQPRPPKAQENDRKRHRRDESDSQPSECRRCGHIISSCSKCDFENQTADFCHNCRDNSPQRALARLASFLTNYDRYQAFTCNVVPNATQKRDEIYEVVMSIDRIVSSELYSLTVTNNPQSHSRVQLSWNIPFIQKAVALGPETAFCDFLRKSQPGAESADLMRGGSKWALSKEVAVSLSGRESQRLFAPFIIIPRNRDLTKPGTSPEEAVVYPQLDVVFSASPRQMMPEPWQTSWELSLLRDLSPTREYAIRCLLHCDISIDALNAELGFPNAKAPDSRKDAICWKDHHHRRLSALRTRLRVLTTLLILQMSVATQHPDMERSDDEQYEECSLDSRSLSCFGASISRCMNKYLPWWRKWMSVIPDHAHSIKDFVRGLASLLPATVLCGHSGLGSASFRSLTMKLCNGVGCPITVEQRFLELSDGTGDPGWASTCPPQFQLRITSTIEDSCCGPSISY